MKTKASVLSLLLLLLTSAGMFAQHPDHLWSYQGKNKSHTLGIYAGLSGGGSQVMDDVCGIFSAKAGLVFNHRWTIGVAGSGLACEQKLYEVVDDGAYRLEAAWAGTYIEYLQPLGKHIRLSASVMTAAGVARYRYDKASMSEKAWYEEVIDEDRYGMLEGGVEVLFRIGGNWWAGLNGSVRNASPIHLKGSSQNLLDGSSAGLSLRYGIF